MFNGTPIRRDREGDEPTLLALARYPVVDLRAEPKFRSERVHQVVFGEVLRLLEEPANGDYVLVEDVRLGYKGYAKQTQLLAMTDSELQEFIAGKRVLKVSRPFCRTSGAITFMLPFGSRVYLDQEGPVLPDGKRFELADEPTLEFESVIELAFEFIGVPYLWGGTSSYGFDCSGFTNRLYDVLGVDIPRDAHEQEAHLPSVEQPKPGDLLFMEGHVMMYIGDGKVIHANGHDMCVQVTDLDDSDYGRRLRSEVRKVGRVL